MSGTCNVPSVMSCTLSVISYTKTSVVSILYPLFCDFSYYPSVLYCTDPLTFFCDFSYCTSMLYCTDPPSLFLWFLVLPLYALLYWPPPSLFSVISRIAPHCFSVLTSSVYNALKKEIWTIINANDYIW